MMVPCLLLTIFLLPFSNNYCPGGLFDKLVERREEYLALCCGVFLNDGPIFTCEGPCCFHFPTMIVPKDALLSLSKIYGGERDKHPPTCTHTHAHTHTHTHTHARPPACCHQISRANLDTFAKKQCLVSSQYFVSQKN